MPKCAMISCAVDVNLMADHYPILSRALLLAVIFASGCFEAFVLKLRKLACSTWFIGLGGLTAWIAYPAKMPSIIAASVVFVSGLILLISYYRNWKSHARKPS